MLRSDYLEPEENIMLYNVYMYKTLDIQYKTVHDKTYKMEYAPKEDSAQPGHLLSLIRLLLCTQWVAKDPSFLHADKKDL